MEKNAATLLITVKYIQLEEQSRVKNCKHQILMEKITLTILTNSYLLVLGSYMNLLINS